MKKVSYVLLLLIFVVLGFILVSKFFSYQKFHQLRFQLPSEYKNVSTKNDNEKEYVYRVGEKYQYRVEFTRIENDSKTALEHLQEENQIRSQNNQINQENTSDSSLEPASIVIRKQKYYFSDTRQYGYADSYNSTIYQLVTKRGKDIYQICFILQDYTFGKDKTIIENFEEDFHNFVPTLKFVK